MALHGWVTAGLLSIVAAAGMASAQESQDDEGADERPQVLLKAQVVDLPERRPARDESPTISELGDLYRKMNAEKPIEERQAEGRKLLRSLDELIAIMPICDDEMLTRQMLDFGKVGDLYLAMEHYPKAVRAYMEAVKRSYRNEAEALRQGNESSASAHELSRVQALRGMSCAWYYEAKRSRNSTYAHVLFGRAMDVRSGAYEIVMARRRDGRSAGTVQESTIDDLLQLGRMAAALGDDRSVASYARLAAEEMEREEKEKRLRRDMSLVRIYAGALEGVKSGRDMIDTIKRLDVLIRYSSQ